MSLVPQLKSLGVLQGRGKTPKASRHPGADLLKLCHGRRLLRGLSVSLAVTPDEALGPLVQAMGGPATQLRIIDVRTGGTGASTQLEVQYVLADPLREEPVRRVEKWEVEGVAGLVHNLNDLYRDERDVRLVVVLGEWEDMLQLWALERGHLRALLEDGVLAEARNRSALSAILNGDGRSAED